MSEQIIKMDGFYLIGFKSMATGELWNISEYAAKVEGFLSGELKAFEAQVTEHAEKLDEEERGELYADAAQDFATLGDEFPNIMRASLFTYTYSFLEHKLATLCEEYRYHQRLTLTPTDLKGDGILRAKNYLMKVAGTNFPEDSQAWKDVNMLRQLRNLVTHNGGHLNDSGVSKELQEFLTRFRSLTVEGQTTLRFSKDFVPDVVKVVNMFFNDLFSVLQKDKVSTQ